MSVEDRLEEWREAKQRADYDTADRIRAELRAEGVDPDKRRRTGGGSSYGSRREPSVEEKIQTWQDAKARKDFATADRIRSELRAQGVEPDPVGKGPPMFMTPAAPVAFTPPTRHSRSYEPPPFERRYDARLEADLDDWEEARERKDFATADDIRQRLRSRGISPAKERGRRSIEDELHEWQRAKQAKDFARSDRIRAQLRQKGIDVDAKGGSPAYEPPAYGVRQAMPSPREYAMPSYAMSSYSRPPAITLSMDVALELSQWYDARDAKDFDTSDKIRDRVRRKGIEPRDCPRPAESLRQLVVDLANWYDAKDRKDFHTADRLRSRLRDNGIEPQDCERPLLGGSAGNNADDETEDALRAWYAAKEKKDFVTADQIREELRSRGIEPATCPRPTAKLGNVEDEEALEKWYDAKDARDFETADAIRESLRAKGIEPSQCPRPKSGYGRVKAENGSGRSAPYGSGKASASFDMETEEKLDMWWLYKQERDFAKADKVRADLRKMGIEPEQFRPKK